MASGTSPDERPGVVQLTGMLEVEGQLATRPMMEEEGLQRVQNI